MCQVVKVFSNYRNFRLQPKYNLNTIINLWINKSIYLYIIIYIYLYIIINKFIIINLWLNICLA